MQSSKYKQFLQLSLIILTPGYCIHSINHPGRLFNFGPMRVGVFSKGCLLFSQHFQQVRTFLENNKRGITSYFTSTRQNKVQKLT